MSGLVFLLVAAALSVPASATPVFTCSNSGSNLVCSALGDLYYATNGTGWTNNSGWSSAADGKPTDYCTFYSGGTNYSATNYSVTASTLCPSGPMPVQLCVALIARLGWA
jgi:hypothetical protein